MASELRVNTLKDASGNNSVGMSYVAEGTAKCWCSLNGTGTISVRDSFNTSSITDHGSGVYSTNINSNMNNDGYVPTGSAVGSSSSNYYSFITSNGSNAHLATGSLRFGLVHYSGAFPDLDRVHISIDGDLA